MLLLITVGIRTAGAGRGRRRSADGCARRGRGHCCAAAAAIHIDFVVGDWGSGEGPVRIYVFVVEKGHQTRLWPLLALNSPFGVRPLEKKRKRTVKPV